jgi:molybdopterin synthase catalytic subunit
MFFITKNPIDISEIIENVRDKSSGAIALFLGTIRERRNGQYVIGMYYESYDKMAKQILKEIEGQVKLKWKVSKLLVVHRIGNLKIADISVAVAISSKHRKEAFEACRYTLEAIKRKVPIWKKEITNDGDFWVQGHLLEGD